MYVHDEMPYAGRSTLQTKCNLDIHDAAESSELIDVSWVVMLFVMQFQQGKKGTERAVKTRQLSNVALLSDAPLRLRNPLDSWFGSGGIRMCFVLVME